MEGVKTGGEERVQVPDELLELLRWHVDTQLRAPAQRHSDLLFPSLDGGFRACSVLDKPFRSFSGYLHFDGHQEPRKYGEVHW